MRCSGLRRNASRVRLQASTPDLPLTPRLTLRPQARATRRTTDSAFAKRSLFWNAVMTRSTSSGSYRGNTMRPPRRQFLHLAAGAAALSAVSTIVGAQTYPSRPVTIIVPFAAGGTTDVVARIVGEHVSHTLGQQFVVENVVGAGGTTGSTRTMRANPDGYTIQVGQMGTHAASVAFYPNLAYKPDVDFEPIGMLAGLPIVLTARKD